MTLKKIISILTVLMVTFTIPASIYAENETVENTTTENETESNETIEIDINVSLNETQDLNISLNETTEINETEVNENETEVPEEEIEIEEDEVLSDQIGAQVRLLQLQKRIEIQIENANTIINKINEENITDANISKLETIIADFELIVEEINNTNFNQSSDELAQEFVALKKEAIELSKEFRDEVRGIFKSNIKAQLKEKIEAKKQERLAMKDERIEKLKQKYNAKKTRAILKKIGSNSEEIASQIESGNLTIEEAKKQIREIFMNMTPEEKRNAAQEIREEQQRIKIESKQRIEQIRENSFEKREEIKEKIKEKNSERGKKAKNE